MCPSTTFTLSIEKVNTTDIKDKYDGMLSQIVAVLKKGVWEIKMWIEFKKENKLMLNKKNQYSQVLRKPNNP